MNNNPNPYQQQVPPPIPHQGSTLPPPPSQLQDAWAQRMRKKAAQKATYADRTLPNWLVGKSVTSFFIAFLACTVVWGYPMEIQLAVISSISLLLFFFGCKAASQNWAGVSERVFIRNVFVLGLVIRLLWVLYCYFFFNPEHYGTPYGDGADVEWYMPFGEAIANWIRGKGTSSFSELIDEWCSAIDDVGYPIWLAVLNILTGGESDVLFPFVVKCIVGGYCAVCVYHVANRHFGEGTARMAALFVTLNPNLIYWCGNMFKEAELVFLCCLCVDLMDRVFTSGTRLTFKGLLPGILVGFSLFFFRTALGIVMFLAMFAHIVMSSKKVMSVGKKVIAGVLVAITLVVGMGDRFLSQTERIVKAVQSDEQAKNMEWRSGWKGGNSYAKYASAAVFAPLIFTIPFPTFNVALDGQILQRLLSGGNYIKNIFSFFVIWVMFIMLLSGEWRRHVFILAYTIGYLACLVLSNFAHSSRFHMPIWPMLLLFAAYGIQMAKSNKYKKMQTWYWGVLVVEVVVCLAWNWFKLAGRGMI